MGPPAPPTMKEMIVTSAPTPSPRKRSPNHRPSATSPGLLLSSSPSSSRLNIRRNSDSVFKYGSDLKISPYLQKGDLSKLKYVEGRGYIEGSLVQEEEEEEEDSVDNGGKTKEEANIAPTFREESETKDGGSRMTMQCYQPSQQQASDCWDLYKKFLQEQQREQEFEKQRRKKYQRKLNKKYKSSSISHGSALSSEPQRSSPPPASPSPSPPGSPQDAAGKMAEFPGFVRIVFRIHYATEPGRFLQVVGSVPELGSWNCFRAPVLQWTDGDYWTGEAYLPVVQENASSSPFSSSSSSSYYVEYKYVVTDLVDILLWENGENRRLGVRKQDSNITIYIKESWNK